ncbi:MAG: SPOR domain-containing protein [Woeseiaceae bacterium]|nr:SPOR domain-containing protein [Woeseiaceae bacterium]
MKERIIGAIVLVAVVVLVVPVFLDGPPDDDEIVSERVPLPGQTEQKTQTVVLNRDRSEPVPTSAEPTPVPQRPSPAVTETRPEPQRTVVAERAAEPESQSGSGTDIEPEAEPVEEPPSPAPRSTPPRTEVARAPASSTGMFAVQLGSFSSQENAERLAADLRAQGFAAFLSQLSTSSGQLHRVRIGPQKDREAAEAMAARLATAGHDGQVVPHP